MLLCPYDVLAGRVGFEPTAEFPQHSLSRRAQSATLAPPRMKGYNLEEIIEGGGGGIRTHGGFPHTCFQDKRLKPLGHPSN